MSLKPNLVTIPENERSAFARDVEKALDGNLLYGEHGFNFIKDVNFNTDATNVIRYKKGPMCKNLNAQFIMVEIPDAAVGTYQTGNISHDLKRVPVGIEVIAMSGVKQNAGFPYSLTNNYVVLNTKTTDPNSWNDKTIQITVAKLNGTTDPTRLILVLL